MFVRLILSMVAYNIGFVSIVYWVVPDAYSFVRSVAIMASLISSSSFLHFSLVFMLAPLLDVEMSLGHCKVATC